MPNVSLSTESCYKKQMHFKLLFALKTFVKAERFVSPKCSFEKQKQLANFSLLLKTVSKQNVLCPPNAATKKRKQFCIFYLRLKALSKQKRIVSSKKLLPKKRTVACCYVSCCSKVFGQGCSDCQTVYCVRLFMT